MDYLDSFGEWLRQRREALRLTRPELADCAGCSVSGLRKIETDERRPSRQLAELLATCLRIPAEEQLLFLDVARGARPVARLGRAEPRPLADPQPSHALSHGASPSRSSTPPLWNLPSPASPLIGRDTEMTTLAQLLSDPGCRLLTLVGPGGIGKTRLAIEAACYGWEQFTDGVFFASLATTGSPEFIVPAIAQAAGLNFSGPAEPRSQLINHLRNKSVLLLLDNLEHLLEGVEELTALLAGAPGVKLLVTSRERLELQEEWVVEVQGLPVPPEGVVPNVEKYGAVQLFLQRAHRARTNFDLSPENLPHMARICRLVEGMPLAIELAAAWVPVLSTREIADEIERGLDLMTSPSRDVPERQRSLRAAFEHSWRLLTVEERQTLRQLSVFRGGFQREAARSVAGANLQLLSALLAKSFLHRSTTGRFSVHELIRQYAAEQLQDNVEEARSAHTRHCLHYADLLVRLEPTFKSEHRQVALETVMPELDNVRAAWRWATENYRLTELRRMSPFLFYFYETTSMFYEGESAYRRALERIRSSGQSPDGPGQADAIGFVTGTLGWFTFRLGNLPQALQYLHESWAYISEHNDLESHFHAHTWLGYVTWATGDMAEARRALDQALLVAQQTESPWHAAAPRVLLGMVLHAEGACAEAYDLLSEALGFWRATGDPRGLAFALASLGVTTFALGNVEEAASLLRDSVILNEEIDDRWGQTYALNLLASVLCAQVQCGEAETMLRRSLAISQEIGDSMGEAQTWLALGDTLAALGDDGQAQRAYDSAWTLAVEGQMTAVLIGAAIGSAEINQRQEQAELALTLLFQVLAHPATSEENKARATQLYTELSSQLSQEKIAAVRAKADKLSLETFSPNILAPSLGRSG